ncbi:MAG TPA: class I SAM-dependent methyltransferase [Candidatus Paceibacterota bacterium]|nr:class I SAM-dependent methyltransferase [Candidatus Paceibacterota bacterium]
MDKVQRVNQKHYDTHASSWANSKTHSFYSEKEFRKFVVHLKGKATVLDIGCGHGRDVPLFLGIGRKVSYEGLDISKKMLAIAKSHYPQLKFYQGNLLEQKSLPKKKYEGFWAAATLQHIPEKDWDVMLTNISSIMKRGAIGYFSLPDDRPNPVSKKDPRHFTLLSEKQVRSMLKEKGWKIVKKGTLPATRGTTLWRWYIVVLS